MFAVEALALSDLCFLFWWTFDDNSVLAELSIEFSKIWCVVFVSENPDRFYDVRQRKPERSKRKEICHIHRYSGGAMKDDNWLSSRTCEQGPDKPQIKDAKPSVKSFGASFPSLRPK